MAGDGYSFQSNIINHLTNEMQSPCHPTLIACRLCDRVFMGAHALVRHFQLSHMIDNKIVHEGLNLQPYPNELDQFHDLFPPNFSPRTSLCEMHQFTQKCSQQVQPIFIEQNPNFNTSQVLISDVEQEHIFHPNGKIHKFFPSSSTLYAVPTVQLEPHPTPPPLIHTPQPQTLTPPVLSLFVTNCTFGQPKPYAQGCDQILETQCSCDGTKLYINKLDQPIREIIEVAESDEENDENIPNPNKLDLSLKL